MGIIELYLIAVGLSFDTFAASVSVGISTNQIKFWQGVRVASVLAVFQGLMPYLGFMGGVQISKYISHLDHWVAFFLLFGLGLKMIYESCQLEKEKRSSPLNGSVLLFMAVATSIDALVVGISFAFVSIDIWMAIFIIGTITFFSAMIGMLLGKKASGRFGKKMETLGGIILIAIGLKILLAHMLA